MMKIHRLRDHLSAKLRDLHKDQAGINAIEMVLILCAAAVVLALAFKLLWGQNNDGKIATHITTTIKNFTSLFTWNNG